MEPTPLAALALACIAKTKIIANVTLRSLQTLHYIIANVTLRSLQSYTKKIIENVTLRSSLTLH